MTLIKSNIYPPAKKNLGQNFLVNERIAEAEAVHGEGKNVLELGPGQGILTRLLCKKAKRVVAVEKDPTLYGMLKAEIKSKKLRLLKGDFFEFSDQELELGDTDILISNIPYALSSKTIEWLSEKGMQAILCLQKEFVDHMLAKEDSDKYTNLSVISTLSFSVTRIMDVPRGNFRPMPRVDSAVIYLKPKDVTLDDKEVALIKALMQHKKKTVRSAFIDCQEQLGISKAKAIEIAGSIPGGERRLFKINPHDMLELAKSVKKLLE